MYLDSLNPEVKQYFKILSPEFPMWLLDYIETKQMQRLHSISMCCGIDYTQVFNIRYFYSNLDHSVAVALIIWHFTKDKKQTLAGLFHDIATPCFKHCVDFLNGDHEKQESTEEKTLEIIENASEIRALLKRDNILLSEICDYQMYPIADNPTPGLSADRFEYNFSSGLVFYRVWNLEDIEECYNNIKVLKNEEGVDELGFRDELIAEKYVHTVSQLWPQWICNKDKVVMQFIADILLRMKQLGYLSIDELYIESEATIIDKILHCENESIREAFKCFQTAKQVKDSEIYLPDKYCVSVKAKQRYIVPLTQSHDQTQRITKLSQQAKQDVEEYLNYQTARYGYFDFNFE